MADKDARPDGAKNERLRRITFRAWRRGFREADMVLGPFSDQVAATLNEAELDALEALLGVEDRLLYGWIVGREPAPAEHAGPVMDKLQHFMRTRVAAAVVQGIG